MKKALLTVAATFLLSASGSASTIATAGGAELEPRDLESLLPAGLVEQLLEEVGIDPSDAWPSSVSSESAEPSALAAPGADTSAPDAWLTVDDDSSSPLGVGPQIAPREPRRATVVIEAFPGPVLLIDSATTGEPPLGLR